MSQTIEQARLFLKHPSFQTSDLNGVDLEICDAASRIAAAKAIITSAKKFEENGETDLANEAMLLANNLVDEAVEEQLSGISDLT